MTDTEKSEPSNPIPDEAGESKSPPEKKTFTQEEVNVLLGERAERMKNLKEKATAELLAALGVESMDAAKDMIKKKHEADELEKTDLQKAQEEAQKAKEDAQKAKDEAERIKGEQLLVLAQARETLVNAEVLRQAVSFKDQNGNAFRLEAINDVWLVLDKATITDGENGEFKGIKEAVEEVAKERPHWLLESKKQPTPHGTPNTNNQKPTSGNSQTPATNRRPFTL